MIIRDGTGKHKDEILEWAISAPEPEDRAKGFQKELGRRRRGPRYSEYQGLPRHRQQTIARNARMKSLAALREKRRKKREAQALKDFESPFDPDT